MTIKATFWDRWLQLVAAVIVGFGLLLALLNNSGPMQVLFHRQIDPTFWPDGPPLAAQAFRTWAYGILGATMAGWGVAIWALARTAFVRRERWARDALAAGVLIWFVLDTWLSLASGVTFNALFNTLFLLLMAPPLLATWRQFSPRVGSAAEAA